MNILNPYRYGGVGLYPLDLFPNAVYGFALKKLKSTATLACRVQRTSDSAETDVYLYDDPTLSIDLNSEISAGGILGDWIETTINTYTTKVVTMYDQSGNGNDITGSFSGLYYNGLQVDGGSEGYGDGLNTRCRTLGTEQMSRAALTAFDSGNTFTIIGAGNMFSVQKGCLFATATSGNRAQMYMDRSATDYISQVIAATTTATSVLDAGFNNVNNNMRHQISVFNGGTTTLDSWRDANADDSGDTWSGSYNNTGLYVGYLPTTNNGSFLELIAFSDDKTASISDIYTNFTDRYGT